MMRQWLIDHAYPLVPGVDMRPGGYTPIPRGYRVSKVDLSESDITEITLTPTWATRFWRFIAKVVL